MRNSYGDVQNSSITDLYASLAIKKPNLAIVSKYLVPLPHRITLSTTAYIFKIKLEARNKSSSLPLIVHFTSNRSQCAIENAIVMCKTTNFALLLMILCVLCLNGCAQSQKLPSYLSNLKQTPIIPRGPSWPARAEDYDTFTQMRSTKQPQRVADHGSPDRSPFEPMNQGGANRVFLSDPPTNDDVDYLIFNRKRRIVF